MDKVEQLEQALHRCLAVLQNADVITGYCCCGLQANAHPYCGHAYVDMGGWEAEGAIKMAKAALGEEVEPEMIPFGENNG